MAQTLPHSELPFLSPVVIEGTTKGLDPTEGYASQEAISAADQFVRLSDEDYTDGVVAITVASDHLPLHRILVPDLTKSRKNANPPLEHHDPVPPESVLHNNFKSLFEYIRAEGRISALYDNVEHVALSVTKRGLRSLYSTQITLPFYADNSEATQWAQLTRRVRQPLGTVTNPLKVEAALELEALGNVFNKNTRCTALMKFMTQDRLTKRADEMKKIDVSVTKRMAGAIRVLDSILFFTERIQNVARQALPSRSLMNPYANRVKTNAVGFWRCHADELESCVVEPFRTMFQPIATCFVHGADALEQNDTDEARHQMTCALELCSLVDLRVDLEGILSPVAEMREIQKRREMFTDPGYEALWNETKVLWTSLEIESLIAIVTRQNSTITEVRLVHNYELLHLHHALIALREEKSLAKAYVQLKLIAEALEMPVILK